MLSIKAGKFEYDELLQLAEVKQQQVNEAFETSALQEYPDRDYINQLTFKLRNQFYQEDDFQ